jgi:UDP-N-acetylglucosamine diphosphorylase / glucose-1-phosphate thymidylyltransferase / UDP-N-acetylgalactosamine diphosphorylase / glucosamine-1-phosphate N-acetyltransferase / galactosamine-1-phosphate N-acetyltransferase
MSPLDAADLFDMDQTIAAELFSGRQYPWEVLPDIAGFILTLQYRLPDGYEQIGDLVWAGKGTKIAASTEIKGPALIGFNCEIRHCAYIRGSVIIGDGCVVGNSTELKNAILFNSVQVPHFNYVGDSVLGYKAHLGAGSIVSNVKSDKGTVTVKLPDGSVVDTKLKKFGAMVGHHVEVGCNSVLNPGTVIGQGSVVYPVTMARGYIPPNHILKNNGELVEKKQ